MSETKFTPGDWHVELGEVHEVRDSEGGRICILTQLRGRHGMGGRRPDGESAANAHLIAAAPDLYAALKAVEWSDEGTCPLCSVYRNQMGGTHSAGCSVAAALAKARGEGK